MATLAVELLEAAARLVRRPLTAEWQPELCDEDWRDRRLSDRAMEKAQSGYYNHFEVQRGLPIRQLVRNFQRSDDMWVLRAHIREMVRWRRLNLVQDQTAPGGFDVIFCRNVICNMTPDARQRTLEGLAHALSADGFLFLGDGESPQTLSGAFHAVADRPGLYARNPAFRLAA